MRYREANVGGATAIIIAAWIGSASAQQLDIAPGGAWISPSLGQELRVDGGQDTNMGQRLQLPTIGSRSDTQDLKATIDKILKENKDGSTEDLAKKLEDYFLQPQFSPDQLPSFNPSFLPNDGRAGFGFRVGADGKVSFGNTVEQTESAVVSKETIVIANSTTGTFAFKIVSDGIGRNVTLLAKEFRTIDCVQWCGSGVEIIFDTAVGGKHETVKIKGGEAFTAFVADQSGWSLKKIEQVSFR